MEKWQQHHNFFDSVHFSGEEKDLVLTFLQFWRKEKAKIYYRVRKKNNKVKKKWRVKNKSKIINNTIDNHEASIELMDTNKEPVTISSTVVPVSIARKVEGEIEHKVEMEWECLKCSFRNYNNSTKCDLCDSCYNNNNIDNNKDNNINNDNINNENNIKEQENQKESKIDIKSKDIIEKITIETEKKKERKYNQESIIQTAILKPPWWRMETESIENLKMKFGNKLKCSKVIYDDFFKIWNGTIQVDLQVEKKKQGKEIMIINNEKYELKWVLEGEEIKQEQIIRKKKKKRRKRRKGQKVEKSNDKG